MPVLRRPEVVDIGVNTIYCYGKRVTVFAAAIAAGDSVKYQSFIYGSFVWEICVSYNNDSLRG